MNFDKYLKGRQARDNIQGDFVRDARAFAGMAEITTWPQLKRHLQASDASAEVVEAGRLVWAGYRQRVRSIV